MSYCALSLVLFVIFNVYIDIYGLSSDQIRRNWNNLMRFSRNRSSLVYGNLNKTGDTIVNITNINDLYGENGVLLSDKNSVGSVRISNNPHLFLNSPENGNVNISPEKSGNKIVFEVVTVPTITHGPEEALLNRSSVLFVAVSFILLMVISLAWLIFYYVQRFRYLHSKERVSVSFMYLCTF